MNFLLLGYCFVVFNINIGNIANYALKILGFLFIYAGLREYAMHDKSCTRYCPAAIRLLILSVLSTAGLTVCKLFVHSSVVNNIVIIVLGLVVTFASVDYQRRLLDRIMRSGEGKIHTEEDGHVILRPFTADVKDVGKAWRITAVFTVVGTLFEALNRIITQGVFHDIMGGIILVTKIVAIITAVIFLVKFNHLRVGYNKEMDNL